MAKCYVISCIACGLLCEVARRDARTCSTQCRTRLHRHPELRASFDRVAADAHADLFDMLEAKALDELRPDLFEAVLRGELTLEGARDDVHAALIERVQAALA